MPEIDDRFLDEIEQDEVAPPPGAGAALALSGAVVAAGLLVFGIPAVLILLFT